MKTKYLQVLILLLLFVSCGAFKNGLKKNGGDKEAVENAILDFSNTSGLFKRDSVFTVGIYNELNRMVLETNGNGNDRWVEGKPYEGIIAVNISASYDKMLLTDSIKVGKKGVKIPTRFVEKEGNLFYWWDDDYPLTQEALDIFSKYGLLQDDEGGWVKFPDFSINDAQKGVDYYFCKNDLSQYKKIVTNKGIGFYDAPKLDCK